MLPSADTLRRLAALKAISQECKAASDAADREYRGVEAEVVEAMTQAEMTSMKVAGLASFTLTARTWNRVTNMRDFLEHAAEAELVDGVSFDADGTLTARLRPVIDDEMMAEGTERITYTDGGMLHLEVGKAALNAHVKECIDNATPLPPGVEPAVTRYITIRRTQ